MVDESTYNELDRYVSGQMLGAELAAFEAKVSSDSELRDELSWLQSTMKAMQMNGQQVMKQHIASAIINVPNSELTKYSPSKNANSFWKKWWWAIGLGVLTLGVTAWYIFTIQNHHDNHEHTIDTEGGSIVSNANDSMLITMAAQEDSCSPGSPAPAGASIKERVEVFQDINDQPALYYDIGEDDSLRPIAIAGYTRVIEKSLEGNMQMNVTLNVRNTPPFTYKLDSALTLNSAYTSSKAFVFSGKGDTVYMTDDKSNTYMLLRGRGELPLIKSDPRAE